MEWIQGEHVWLKPSREGRGQFFVVRRKLGNAVERNRLKRRLRGIVGPVWPAERGLVVLPRGSAARLSYAALKAELLGLLQQLEKRSAR